MGFRVQGLGSRLQEFRFWVILKFGVGVDDIHKFQP